MKTLYSRMGYFSQNMLFWVSKFSFGKTALAIILFGLVPRFIFLPLQIRQARNTHTLQDLAPEIRAIRARYKPEMGQPLAGEQRRKFEAEIVELYRKKKVQSAMPALVIALRQTVLAFIGAGVSSAKKDARLQQGGILWFRDLSKPDRYFVLPLLLTGVGLIRAIFVNPKTFTSITGREDEQNIWIQRATQILRWFPLTNIFAVRQPAGLVLYRLVSETYTAAEEYLIASIIIKSSQIR